MLVTFYSQIKTDPNQQNYQKPLKQNSETKEQHFTFNFIQVPKQQRTIMMLILSDRDFVALLSLLQ